MPRGQLIRTRTLTVKQRADLVGCRVEQVLDLMQRVAVHEPPSRFENATTDEPERPHEAEPVVVVTKAVQPTRIRNHLVERRERFGGHLSADGSGLHIRGAARRDLSLDRSEHERRPLAERGPSKVVAVDDSPCVLKPERVERGRVLFAHPVERGRHRCQAARDRVEVAPHRRCGR